MPHVFRVFACFLVAACVLLPASALDVPLSDEAVREAYFLGQRHDGSYLFLMGNYIKRLPAPKSGPHISSVTLLTPFIQLVANSDRLIGNYSAQQAALDHRGKEETVRIVVNILLTESYGRLIVAPQDSSSRSTSPLTPRPHDFWKDFQVQAFGGKHTLAPASFQGHADSNCGRRGPCIMYGATIILEFPAESFPSDSISVQVIPPEGDLVSVDFDLTRLR
jgi:hypothetical protein